MADVVQHFFFLRHYFMIFICVFSPPVWNCLSVYNNKTNKIK